MYMRSPPGVTTKRRWAGRKFRFGGGRLAKSGRPSGVTELVLSSNWVI